MNLVRVVLYLCVAACAPAIGAPRTSPHGRTGECASCHVDASGKGFVGGSDTAACRTCHEDGPHQVDIAPTRAKIPADFPLVDGKLACQTCHDEPACDGAEVADDNPRFFRAGPYPRLGDLCARCHTETARDRFDPHTAMRSADPVVRADACLFCHETPPTAGHAEALRLPGVETCRGCHFETSHAGSGEHMVALDGTMAERARAAGLPLTADGRATCATCHDPHPPGTTRAADARAGWSAVRSVPAAWERAVLAPALTERVGERADSVLLGHDMLRLPLEDGSLCRTCHGAGPASGKKP